MGVTRVVVNTINNLLAGKTPVKLLSIKEERLIHGKLQIMRRLAPLGSTPLGWCLQRARFRRVKSTG